MDIQGRPKISRELLERISNNGATSQRAPLGGTSAEASQVSMATRRNLYRSSHLGSRHGVRQVGTEMGARPSRRPNPRPDDTSAAKKVDSGQNRPSSGYTFQEPHGRAYDPFA